MQLLLGDIGTHDNSTAEGWWKEDASKADKRSFREYLGLSRVTDVSHKFIEVGMRSVARTTIFTIQACSLHWPPPSYHATSQHPYRMMQSSALSLYKQMFYLQLKAWCL